ncbi:MAG: hypothetical protein QOJ09_3027 [Actinomycetota bacterium]|nr:hypothetical protein [Actinomycetota bacterium]
MLEALRALDGPVEVVSDSTYVVNCFRDRWWEGWLQRGWLNKAKKPVANRDLWEPLIEEYRRDPSRVRFTWVKGHSDDVMNDLVDRLAVEAARTQQPRNGDHPPETLGEADVIGAPAKDARLPTGHLLAVVGHRPPELGGYDDNDVASGVLRRLTEVIDAKAQLHPDLVVLTGLGLGAEQLGAEAAERAGVPYVVVVPFPDQETVWPAASQQRYRKLLDGSRDTVQLQAKRPESKQQAGAALARRDAWLARHADEAVAVWNGDEPFVGRLVRSLQDHLGEDQVWVLAPQSR